MQKNNNFNNILFKGLKDFKKNASNSDKMVILEKFVR